MRSALSLWRAGLLLVMFGACGGLNAQTAEGLVPPDAQAGARYPSDALLGEAPGPRIVPALRARADAGEACAGAALGYLQAEGVGMMRNAAEGRGAIEGAIGSGCARAHYLLALLLDTPARADAMRKELEAGAAEGDGHALNRLGTLAEVDGERNRARDLYRRARAAGNRAAVQNLLRLDRFAATAGAKEPVARLRERAKAGDAEAQYRLARRIHRGEAGPIDYVQAWQLYRQSARSGFEPAKEMMTLVLAQPGAKSSGKITAKWWARLALVDVPSDPLLRERGLRQPVVDVDPFYGMR